MKDEIAVFLTIVVALICAFIPYFYQYLALPFAIITFFLVLIVLTNFYFMFSFSRRIREVETATKRDTLVLKVIIDAFIELEKMTRLKGITIAQFTQAFGDAVAGVLDAIAKDYFSIPHGNPGPEQERRKQELLQRAHQGQISYPDGQELQRLLEEQKRQHESRGDIGGAILLGLMILFIIGILASLSED